MAIIFIFFFATVEHAHGHPFFHVLIFFQWATEHVKLKHFYGTYYCYAITYSVFYELMWSDGNLSRIGYHFVRAGEVDM